MSLITKANVNELTGAWTYPTNDNVAYVWNPLIVDNVMYVLARNYSLVALDATTGKEIWTHADLQGIAPRGKQGSQGSVPDLPAKQLSRGDKRPYREIDREIGRAHV